MKDYQLSNKSLKFKIMTFSIAIILALGLSSGILMHKMMETSKTLSIEDFKSRAITLQGQIAAQFYERYGDVQAFALNPSIVSMDKAKIIPALNQYAMLYGIYDLIMVVDTQGNLVGVNDLSPEKKPINTQALLAKNYKDQPWFTAVMESKFTNEPKHNLAGTYAEDPSFNEFVKEAYGKEIYGSGFSAPIKDQNGKIIGVITNRAGSNWFEGDFIDLSLAMKEKGLEEFEITMLDKNGIVLLDFNSNDPAIKHDEKILGKLNLAERGLVAAKELIKRKVGSGIFLHESNHQNQVTGYSPINNHKFTPSLGWGIMIRANEELVFKKVNTFERIFYISIITIVLIVLFLAFGFSNSISKNLHLIAENLSNSGALVGSAAIQISSSSEALSQATNEQAASLIETSASIQEISSMVNANSENAKQSSTISEQSLISAEKGKVVVDQMISAIEEINESNNGIIVQIDDTNKEIENIVKIIKEIGSKTKVINDIVFQTKLLSFNASVEAARAGDQGKGFAVVAEEVGNLASMSGAAALEISNMLDGSIKTVEGIVKDSKEKIGRLIVTSKEKVEIGTRVARECEVVLNEIVSSVANVSKLANEIAMASQEQAQGVYEITKSISQLDQVTQQNTSSSADSANAATTLSLQASGLNSIVHSLVATIDGRTDNFREESLIPESLPTPIKNKFDSNVKKEVLNTKAKLKKVSVKIDKEVLPSIAPLKDIKRQNGLPDHNDSRFEDV